MDEATFHRVVETANLAPSVHNTQPARWRKAKDGSILILADCARHLDVGDPSGRDMAVSCGAAAEGTLLALAEAGLPAGAIEDHWQKSDVTTVPGFRLAGRIAPGGAGGVETFRDEVRRRFTWRGGFEAPSPAMLGALRDWASGQGDVCLVDNPADIASLAAIADAAALSQFRNAAFRAELVDWMRLSRRHPRYLLDGMNLEALRMSAVEGLGACLVLGTPLFRALDALGMAGILAGERSKTVSASAIVLFHRPAQESAFGWGRAFYRVWLDVTRCGLSAWPLAILADDEECAGHCARRFGIGEGRRLVNALRVGACSSQPPNRARLPARQVAI